MPELSFVLPHWLYWGCLVLFPVITFVLYRHSTARQKSDGVSLPLAYVLLITGGFIGIHRLYLKSRLALVFIALFIGILFVNMEVRETRNELSRANNEVTVAEFKIKRAEKDLAKGKRNAEQKMQQAEQRHADALVAQRGAEQQQADWQLTSQGLGIAVAVLLLLDAVLLPGLARRCNSTELPAGEAFHCPLVEQESSSDPGPFLFNRVISRINSVAGELVAYWSLIAVAVYYYEVMARYVFNSPTNWAHESMFLMFGMQYLLAGGFVLREGAHVRVDVIYSHLSLRGKAIVDLLTSVFFFIFVATLLGTGWTFFMDSFKVSEVSFTEWAIPYWPIKIALPLGALLLLLQGLSLLIKDIAIVFNPAITGEDNTLRAES